MITRTGGRWDPTAWPTYFIASNVESLVHGHLCHDHLLVAVNELHAARQVQGVRDFVAAGKQVFIDSGVFALSTTHAKAHGLTMDQALSMPPEEVDGFDELFARYTELLAELGDRVWGYIEIDQGGRENKIRTRARLEALGLRPIPVYHPFNDGWDYFDHLAENYDRICFGNVVQADPATRKRLLATAWERRRKYPHLWIHLLGLTPSEMTTAYPINSCDSSTWLSGVRWGTHHSVVANRTAWKTGSGFCYRFGADAQALRGHHRARQLAGYDAGMVARTMDVMAAEQRDVLGVDIGLFERPPATEPGA